jgi:hypothetical protein
MASSFLRNNVDKKCWIKACKSEAKSAGYINGIIRRLCTKHADEVVLDSAHMEFEE